MVVDAARIEPVSAAKIPSGICREFLQFAGNLGAMFSDAAAMLAYSSSAGLMGRNGGELRQPVMRVAKRYKLRAAPSSRCEESLR